MKTSRAFSSISALPFIERPAVTEAIQSCILSRETSVSWIQGGIGCGKSEAIYRSLDKLQKKLSTFGDIVIVVDLNKFKISEISQTMNLARLLNKEIAVQFARQVTVSGAYKILRSGLSDFEACLTTFTKSAQVWSQFLTSNRSLEDVWNRIMSNQSALVELLPSMRLKENPLEEFEAWVNILKNSSKKVSFALMHLERCNCNLAKSHVVFGKLFDPTNKFNVLAECNDSLKSIWNICDDSLDQNIIEVPDLPIEAVKATFVPQLLSDEFHVRAVYSICGGRIGLLKRLVPSLIQIKEEQKVLDQEQEQLYRSGKENRPSCESRDLQISPLIYKREVAIRDSLFSGALKDQVDDFEGLLQKTFSEFTPIVDLGKSLSQIELHVVICESVRVIADTLAKSGYLSIPAGLSPLDISHPVVLALLSANILTVSWLPYPRLVTESPLKRFLLESWYASEMEEMSFAQRPQFSLVAMRNKKHIQNQIQKLAYQ